MALLEDWGLVQVRSAIEILLASDDVLRLPLTLMLIPLNDLLKSSEGSSWSYLKEKRWLFQLALRNSRNC